jgi:hypothetical protein
MADCGTGRSNRGNGAVGTRPVPPDDARGASGSWIVIAGILMGRLHFGHGPVIPANLSLTVNLDVQPGQMTGMAMFDSAPPRDTRESAVSEGPPPESSRATAG